GFTGAAANDPLVPEDPDTAARTMVEADELWTTGRPVRSDTTSAARGSAEVAAAAAGTATVAETDFAAASLRETASGGWTCHAGTCGVVSAQAGSWTRRRRLDQSAPKASAKAA